jgi:hypothetical protein
MPDQDLEEIFFTTYVIFNINFGVRDFVYVGQIDGDNAWLDDPYDMAGPFSLKQLLNTGRVEFEQCIIMSEKIWKETKRDLQQEAWKKQSCFNQEIFNKKSNEDKKYRELLGLPLEESLSEKQINDAYRKAVKKAHPDVGGSHEKFIQITCAKNYLKEYAVSGQA